MTHKPVDSTPIRDASTIIVVRDRHSNPKVLMGQRGSSAVFMPNKFVFPGGAVDDVDQTVDLAAPIDPICLDRLSDHSTASPNALVAAAIRELWEETGLIIGEPAEWAAPPKGWRGYGATGHKPSGKSMSFVFRAITPPGRPRRFDARFFLADADALSTDPDDFSRAEDELRHLQWIPIADARSFDLPFVTEVVLAELMANIEKNGPPENVPFFRDNDEAQLVTRLGGKRPLDAYQID